MNAWIPPLARETVLYRRRTRPRWISDRFARPARRWRFSLGGVYLPRKAIWQGDDLAVRFAVRNDGTHEGTVYYIVRLRDTYRPSVTIACTDDLADRASRFAVIAPGAATTVEVLFPWSALAAGLVADGREAVSLSIEIELWVPRRFRMSGRGFYDRAMRGLRLGRFQSATVTANPTLLLTDPIATCFLSYAWSGAPDLQENEHRAWVYAFGDALAHAGIRAIIDYNFLKPAALTDAVIARRLEAADRVVIVYSDAYLARMDLPGTGVAYEYQRLKSDPQLWAKTFPIRRDVRRSERMLYARERRFVISFEGGDLISEVNRLALHMDETARGANEA